ncbi:MAG: family 10 glycosylhydrolase, partial [Melioribacteraceae bacterium]
AIFDNIKSKNLNTVYFQVRSNGTVLFKSSYDPFSSYITGEINGDASYDPLQLAVEEAHKHGLEIHAWVNVVRCFNGSETKVLNNPNHISKRKPEWIIEDIRDGQRSLWLDPGLPEVREYLSDMIAEIVENYDVDGVHLDYIRYPGRNFDDEFSYSVHGAGLSRDEYRRKNITDLVALINKKIKNVKYYVKLGAAPIGIYKNLKGVNGWEGYTEVYQDSREWLRLGIVDYIVPQIYWGINDNPRFAPIAKDWSDNSFGRSVVLGIGAYKQNVKSEIDQMVQYSRSVNADGVSFFRYENIKDLEFSSFRNKTYPAAMAWLDGIYPDPPADLVLLKKPGGRNKFSLSWNSKKIRSRSDSLSYFALYNLPSRNSELLPDYLYDILPAEKSSADISIDKPRRINYFFALKSVSKLWNESIESSNVAGTKIEEMESLAEIDDFFTRPALIKESGGSSKILIFAKAKEKIEISITDGKKNDMLLLENVSPGKNIFTISHKISDYKRMKIQFKSSLKEFDLKF